MQHLLLLILFAWLATATPSAAYFGKNKVQDLGEQWLVTETDHFVIHFYEAERELALETVPLAEAIYGELRDRLGHEPKRKIPVILYSSHPAFQRTNITSGWIDEGTGGITEFLKRRVFLPYPGSHEEFRHVLAHELTHAFQIDIIAPGGSSREIQEVAVPLWSLEGMAEYLSRPELDAMSVVWLRSALTEGDLPELTELARYRDVRAYRFGQSAWRYLAKVYGEETPGRYLAALRATKDSDAAFQEVFGKSLTLLSREWRADLRREFFPALSEADRIEQHAEVIVKGANLAIAPSLSPSGDWLAYLASRDGSIALCVRERHDGKETRLLAGDGADGLESLRPFHGGPRWSPDSRYLILPAQVGAHDLLVLYDFRERRIAAKISVGLEEVRGLTWSPSGEDVILAGLSGGRTDLYKVNWRTGEYVRLTDDPFVYLQPDWSPDGRTIVCATDRREGSAPLHVDRKLQVAYYDLAQESWYIPAFQAGNNTSPVWAADGDRVAFVSDRDGGLDLYTRLSAPGTTRRITRWDGGVCGLVQTSPALDWARESGEIVFAYYENERWSVAGMPDPIERLDLPMPTPLDPPRYPAFQEVDVAFTDEPSLDPAPIEPYRIRPYRPRFSLDGAVGGGSAVTEGGLYSGSSLSFTDLLGNHRLNVLFGIYGSLNSSDLLVSYENLAGRAEYEVAVFQFSRQSIDWYDGTGRGTLYRGASFGVRWPFDRYHRWETTLRVGEGDAFHEQQTLTFFGLTQSFVRDTVKWSYYGARSGSRLRVGWEPILSDRLANWTFADLRFYREPFDRVVLASRTLGGWLHGERAPAFRVAPRFAVRGFYSDSWDDKQYAVESLELRFPLIDFVQLGWPLPVLFGGIRGALFFDAGVFDDGDRQVYRYSYGPGIRSDFGPVQIMLDFPSKFDQDGRVGPTRGFLQVGREF